MHPAVVSSPPFEVKLLPTVSEPKPALASVLSFSSSGQSGTTPRFKFTCKDAQWDVIDSLIIVWNKSAWARIRKVTHHP
jgi:hypothetical protein